MEIITETPFRTAKRQRRITGGKLTGQKPALKMKEVWSIRARWELRKRVRDLALFNLAIDSKLRACDLTRLKVEDVAAGGEVKTRGIIVQKKTGRPVHFEITEQTRNAVRALPQIQRLPVPKPPCKFPSPLDAAVCADRTRLGGFYRAEPDHLRNALAAAHQSRAHLSKDREPASGAASAWAHQTGKHGSLPRCRGR
jgi:integrase